MAIRNGDLANADTVLNLFGITFKNSMQAFFNAANAGFNSNLNTAGVPDTDNLIYSINSRRMYSGKRLDPFVGTTLDTTLWTLTEDQPAHSNYSQADDTSLTLSTEDWDTGGGAVGINLTLVSNGSTGIKLVTGSYLVDFSFQYFNGSSSTVASFPGISIYDGTNRVVLFSSSPGGAGDDASGSGVYRLNIDKTNETANWTTNLTDTVKTGVSLASLNNAVDWFFEFRVSSSGANLASQRGTSTATLYNFNKIDDTTPAVYTLNLGTVTSTITDGIPIFNIHRYSGTDTTANFTVSVDGTNYENVTDTQIHRFTNTGTNVYVKTSLVGNSTGDVLAFNECALLYNVGAT